MSANPETDDELTPENVRTQAAALLPDDAGADAGVSDDAGGPRSPTQALLGKPARVAIIDALVASGGKPLTAARICDMSGISTTSFGREKDTLIEVGVMREADKVGNAQRYALNTDHPAAQVLVMLDNVLTWGQTPDLLDGRFAGEPGNAEAEVDPGAGD